MTWVKMLTAICDRVLEMLFAPLALVTRPSTLHLFQLDSRDVLLEELHLHAASASEAKQAVALEPARYLPLSPELLLFDVCGPLPDTGALRASKDRRFILACVRLDRLAELRREQIAGAPIEAFWYRIGQPQAGEVRFSDARGKAINRVRRLTIIAASACLLFAGNRLVHSIDASLQANTERLTKEEAALKRRIKVFQEAVAREEARQTMVDQAAIPLSQAVDLLGSTGQGLTPESELTEWAFDNGEVSAAGLASQPEALELSLRRQLAGKPFAFRNAPSADPSVQDWRLSGLKEGPAP